MSMFRTLLVTIWAATICLATPTPMRVEGEKTDLLVKKGIELAESRGLEKRLSVGFSMEKTWNNEVLFGGSWSDTQDDSAESTALSITCLECYTKGMVTAKLWEDLFHPSVRLEFSQVEAYVFLGVETDARGTYSINLFASQSPIGLGFPGLSVGVVFYVDLVFSLSAQIDLTGGFYVKLADDAYLETDIFGGDITDSFFEGISTKSIPVTVQSGSATFKADLRLRVQCGAETTLDVIGIGTGAVVGIYANIIEFVAVIDSTPDCALETREWWDLNAGAYAHLDVVIDYTTIGPVPTVSTTLLTAPTITQCWIEAMPSTTLTVKTSTPMTSELGPPHSSSASRSSLSTSIFEDLSSTYASLSTQPTTPSAFPMPSITSQPVFSSVSALLIASSSRVPFYNSTTTSAPHAASNGSLVTSVIYSTNVYTLTSCAADVVNCPASYQKEVIVTQTKDVFTTVCPVSAQITAPPAESSTITTSRSLPTIVITEQAVVLSPVPTPIKNTFSAPFQTAAFILAAVTAQGAAAGSGSPSALATNSTWPNSTAVSKTSVSTINLQPSGYLKMVSTQSPVAAAAGSLTRPLILVATGLLVLISILSS